MREELKEAVSALRERTGARPVLLPPPYARGHFTVRCAAAPQNDALFTFRMGAGCAFASMTDGYLAALLWKMDASVPRFLPDPARSPEDTLLERILSHGFAEGVADCPQLIRLCLDLDEDPRRSARILERIFRLIGPAYAEALRENRKLSVLPAIARQAVYYKERLNRL